MSAPNPVTPAATGDPQHIRHADRDGKKILGHPMGLGFLFFVEMWERFSYYGMRALLVLYLTSPTTGMKVIPQGKPEGFNPGPGWSDADASTLYGWYTGLAYLLPIVGGIIADKLIGTHRSMLVGGVLIALGHVALGVSGLGPLNNSPAGIAIFMAGLALIIFGTGHFKPCVSVMVGQLYRPDDPRRDGAFSIFYMGINVGAFICAFVCGTLGERVGWHWGFGSAAVGMLLGLGTYLVARPIALQGVGMPPANAKPIWPMVCFVSVLVMSAIVGLVSFSGVFADLSHAVSAFVSKNPAVSAVGGGIVTGAVVIAAVAFVLKQPKVDRGPVATIFIYMMFNAFFWIAFEQAGSSLNLFTDEHVDRNLGSFEVPTTWFQSVNAAFVILMVPFFAWLWTFLAKRKLNPPQPVKIALGLLFLGFGYIFVVFGAKHVASGTGIKASMFLVIAMYFWHTVGELCLSPTGLSYVTRAAPVRLVSLLMGIWFISSFLANLGGGLVAAQVEKIESGEIKLPWSFGGQADYFFLFVVTSFAAGAVILALSPLLRKLQRTRTD